MKFALLRPGTTLGAFAIHPMVCWHVVAPNRVASGQKVVALRRPYCMGKGIQGVMVVIFCSKISADVEMAKRTWPSIIEVD